MITGTTRLVFLIGDPISQVRTPQALNAYFEKHRIDATIVPVHVSADGLHDVVHGIRGMKNLAGLIVTVPHKISMARFCDELGPAAEASGAVNTIRRGADGQLLGEMFDGEGFVSGLRSQGHDPAGKRVLLVGSGGAAAAISFALVRAGLGALIIANRTRSKAEALVSRMRRAFPGASIEAGENDPRGHDMVVNATSLGMRPGDPLPVDADLLSVTTLVAEVVMKPELTPLLERARDKGCPIHYGRHMLDGQIRLIVSFILNEDSLAASLAWRQPG